jgi:ATP-dependent helicase Lhr and Lhr-like helicase
MFDDALTDDPLSGFHPAVRAWFEQRFPDGATRAQALGWPNIRAGHTLIAAPTGSGKTLAAFLVHIDRLYRDAERGELPGGIDVVYVSPLKALVADIRENLERPLAEIAEVARSLGMTAPELGIGMRTGDTLPSERAKLLKRPPHFLVTTPESLYLLVTAKRSRDLLGSVRAVIVDEIHALARDKRGVHLSLTLERLSSLGTSRPTRIGLSATQKPLCEIARLLTGMGDGSGAPCAIVDEGHRRALELKLELPDRELSAVASTEQMLELADRIAEHVRAQRTTLVFTNTRRLAERFAHLLRERLGEDRVAAHHGSLSKERRLDVETRLRAGQLQALVATASLELGIDVGPVELVCQVGSPRSIATFLQRVGRSGHTRFGTPRGILYPLTRDELVECAALLRAVRSGHLDSICIPKAPLDILAQQIVAECGAETWETEQLFSMVRRASPYRDLPREDFDAVVDMVTNGIETGRGKRAAFLHRDGVHDKLRGRRSARLSALTSGGAIPDTADYRVVEEPGDTFVGTINEDFAIESMAGDVFLLGSTSWRIRRVERGVVRVVDAQGAAPTVPFWLGEAPGRTRELSQEVSALRASIERDLDAGDLAQTRETVERECQLDARSTAHLIDYLSAAHKSLGRLPTEHDIVFERFFDDTGGMQLIMHAPFGARINRGLGLLLRKRFCRSFDFELQAAANDDAIVLSLGPQHSFALEDLKDYLSPKGLRDALIHAVLLTPMFQARWRWNLNRALIVLRFKGGKKNPPQIQRMEADDVMACVFPSLAACQDNATGPREIPDHPIVRQTMDDCLSEAIDFDGLQSLLNRIAQDEVRLHFRETTEPSELCHEILNGRPFTFLDDAPLEERRTRAVQLRRGLPLESRDLAALDPDAIDRVRAEAQPEPRDAEELHDVMCEFVALPPRPEWAAWFEALARTGRAEQVHLGERDVWVAHERSEQAALLFGANDPAASETVAGAVVRAHLDSSGPVTVEGLARGCGLAFDTTRDAVAALEQQGFALRGHFDARLPAPQVCSRRLLGRIHVYTQQRLRREIEPVTAQDFMRFLLEFHGVTGEQKRRGPEGVLAVLEQLQGFEAPAGEWEANLLAARLQRFSSDELDAACWSGDVVWARLSPRAASGNPRWANFSRSTPITLAIRDDLSWLLRAVRLGATPEASTDAGTKRVTDALRQRGALFFAELSRETGLERSELEDALWDNVARGLVTSDGFAALRSLLVQRSSAARPLAMRGLRRGARLHRTLEGRWSLLAEPTPNGSVGESAPKTTHAENDDELAEAAAEQLLARYGVVFRDLVQRESFAIPWRNIAWALRRLEARGLVRGGRFVKGFVGEQYALPDAVDGLRHTRRTAASGELVSLSACDPLNLVGIVVPGPRVPAQSGNRVAYRDGCYIDQHVQPSLTLASDVA